ncbi:MAG: 3-phosphoshikimate 1-carboxyvinyltransferase [Puia sp.]|nr:3-phosphoshikimate 1-carboxyvinyltransferase [Puia sp.]
MLVTIKPSGIGGFILAPTSKSSMQRACAAALLAGRTTVIHHPGYSNDDRAALRVIEGLGAVVKNLPDGSLQISSKGVQPSGGTLNCGESGLGIRMFAPLMALSDRPVTVNGEGSLLTRPMDFFDEIFPQLGIKVASNRGKLPLQIQGPLQPRDITIDGSLSSQFLTGLLMAYAAAGAKGVSIRVKNLKSRPYIDLTLQVMEHFGWQVENRNYEEFYFGETRMDAKGSPTATHSLLTTDYSLHYTVEGDWSGGAFLLVAGAIAGPITVGGLDLKSTQADKAIIGALRDCGAALAFTEGSAEGGGLPGDPPTENSLMIGPAALQAFRFDATDCPDLFPPLVALAAYCKGVTTIKGVDRLAHKESNRSLALQQEFGKMGVTIELQGDLMLIHGLGDGEAAEGRRPGTGSTGIRHAGLKGALTHSHHDHRIAMASAVAALRAEGDTVIEEAQAVNKSYPDFYRHLEQLGATVITGEAVAQGH